jgi:asparagine synthase (glutamine-hydrolysing)
MSQSCFTKLIALIKRKGGGELRSLIENDPPITPSGFPLLTDAATRRRLIGNGIYREPWEEETLKWLDTANDPLQRATAGDLSTWLPDDLLVKFDRMAMAHSLEGRAPYLHPDIVKAGLFLPQQQRMNDSASKVALRRIAAKWLPLEILEKPKQGFVLPMKKWLMQWFDRHDSVEEYFDSCGVDFLNAGETVRLIEDDIKQGVANERLLFALVLLFEWYKNHASFVLNAHSVANT